MKRKRSYAIIVQGENLVTHKINSPLVLERMDATRDDAQTRTFEVAAENLDLHLQDAGAIQVGPIYEESDNVSYIVAIGGESIIRHTFWVVLDEV